MEGKKKKKSTKNLNTRCWKEKNILLWIWWDLTHDATSLYSLWFTLQFKSLSHIHWNLYIILFIHVVYFNDRGCLNVNRPKTLKKVRSYVINWKLRVQRAPITVRVPPHKNRTDHGVASCLVSPMWLGTLTQTHKYLSKTKHKNVHGHQGCEHHH